MPSWETLAPGGGETGDNVLRFSLFAYGPGCSSVYNYRVEQGRPLPTRPAQAQFRIFKFQRKELVVQGGSHRLEVIASGALAFRTGRFVRVGIGQMT
jgi:hypothetical protein